MVGGAHLFIEKGEMHMLLAIEDIDTSGKQTQGGRLAERLH